MKNLPWELFLPFRSEEGSRGQAFYGLFTLISGYGVHSGGLGHSW